ncbi:hypothetical protein C8R45DRAFT_357154 [Mycena sanguinolenta]|nr:hypothetical protein C8R45DRAFT_357154 [Mycena sanguinolenta]
MYFALKTLISLASLVTLVQSCGTAGGFCGSAAGGIPCCAGLTCLSKLCNTWRVLRLRSRRRSLLCRLDLFRVQCLPKLCDLRRVLRRGGRSRSLLCRLNMFRVRRQLFSRLLRMKV